MKIYKYIACVSILVSACGGQDGGNRLQLGDPKVVPADAPLSDETPAPLIKLIKPAPGDQPFEPQGRIYCVAEVRAQAGGRLPEAVNFELRRGNAVAGSQSAVVKEEKGGTYTVQASIEAPKTPGDYTLRAEAIRTVIREGKAADPDGRKTLRDYSEEIKVKISGTNK